MESIGILSFFSFWVPLWDTLGPLRRSAPGARCLGSKEPGPVCSKRGARRCIFDTSKKARGCSWSGFELKWIASTNRICSKGDKVTGLSLNSFKFNYKTRMCLQSYHGQTRTLNAKSTRWCSDIKTSWSILIRHPGNSSLCLWLCPSCEPSCKSL